MSQVGQYISDISQANLSACDEVMAKNMADTLHKHYPNHLWAVQVRSDQGIATVFNLSLSGNHGFMIKLKELDPEYRMVMRAGGELLERYRVRRTKYNPDDIHNIRTDFVGRKIADV